VTDVEPPSGPDDADSGGGFVSLLNTTPKVIGSITALIAAISGLLIALNKAGLLGDGNDPETEEAKSLFGPVDRPFGRVYFNGKTMYVHANGKTTPLVHLANQVEALQDVAMSTRVRWESGAADYGFSLLCRYRNPKNYYLLGVLSGGRYNIARYRDGQLTSLTRGFQQSPHIAPDENDVTVRCVGDRPTTLTLEVDGRQVGEVSDAVGLPGGNVGIRVGSGESFVTLSFEDFLLKYL
jgi:hypothetical protein